MSSPSHLKHQKTTYEDYGAFYCPSGPSRLEPLGLPKGEIKLRGKCGCSETNKLIERSDDVTSATPKSIERPLASALAKNIDQVELHLKNKESVKLDVRKQ
ncbi:unnamed protein product [Dibothriocephalus latus]|uniref:Uncharacterized protein n=1 Tax=Dibothriocephalus latus TaxID=60516 RepID=A0A3P7L902_DIBLA|nr:unnamed protein product [Dibothriocephalus latus]